MLLLVTALKPYIGSMTKEYFRNEEDEAALVAADGVAIIFIVIFFLLSAYGAARLSYYYNMSIGNSGSAIFWSILAFLFNDLYYPYYSFFLNPLSARRGNNIVI